MGRGKRKKNKEKEVFGFFWSCKREKYEKIREPVFFDSMF